MAKKILYWSDTYNIGIKEIDEQHEKIIDILNDANNAFLNKDQDKKIEKIVQDMLNYTRFHFETEEALFKKYSYPDSQAHIKEHNKFIEKVTNFKDNLHNNKVKLTIEIIVFLQKWLVEHILNSDKKYHSFFKEKGLR